MTITITRQDLARMFPRALPNWFEAMLRLAPPLMEFYGFNRLDWCGICGQIDAECDGLALAKMQENMNMGQADILRLYKYRLGVAIAAGPVFGKRYTSREALARDLAHNPIKLADVVYGGPDGREGTPAWRGSLYIGRGPLQETHLDNYRAARNEIRRQPGGTDCPDLLEHPELLATDPELGIRDVFAQWHLKKLSQYAQRKEWAVLSDVLNTGNAKDNVKPHGLARRLRATGTALGIWQLELGPVAADKITGVARANGSRLGDSGEDVKRLQVRLNELGYFVGATDGEFGIQTKRKLVAFQAEHELLPDGIAGARTWEVLNMTAPADLGERANLTVADLAADGSETIATTQRAKWWLKWTTRSSFAGAVDKYMDLGVVDGAVAKAEQVKSLMARGGEVASGLPPVRGLLPVLPSGTVVLFLVAVGVGWLLSRQFNKIEQRRLKDAQSGAHLGRGKPTND